LRRIWPKVLPAVRTTDGKPSLSDFKEFVLPDIIEVFATNSSRAFPLISGRDDYQIVTLINSFGFPIVAATGIVSPDGSSVSIYNIAIDLELPEVFT